MLPIIVIELRWNSQVRGVFCIVWRRVIYTSTCWWHYTLMVYSNGCTLDMVLNASVVFFKKKKEREIETSAICIVVMHTTIHFRRYVHMQLTRGRIVAARRIWMRFCGRDSCCAQLTASSRTCTLVILLLKLQAASDTAQPFLFLCSLQLMVADRSSMVRSIST